MSKTTRLIGSDAVKGIMELVLETQVADPFRVGFVSFTRAARSEASTRAAAKFGVKASDLEKSGWFRTLHSVAYRQLGVSPGELLAGGEEDSNWLKDVLGDDKARVGPGNQDDDMFALPSDQGESCRALALWESSRNRLRPLEDTWEAAYATDSRVPSLETCQAVVTVYEAAKAEGGRLDFCDLLLRFAGRQWTGRHEAPFAEVEPDGVDPMLPVWIGDEMQDSSPLSWLVFQRLIKFAQWAYLAGDGWQSIYSFGGCDGRIFQDCPVAKEEILPISYRCPSNILAAADAVMLKGGHKPRAFRSEKYGGDVLRTDVGAALQSVKAGEDTLVLARTNEYARAAAAALDDALVPWVPTKGGGGFNAPARAAGVAALVTLKRGGGIEGESIHRLLELVPSSAGGTPLFVRGSKKYYEDNRQAHKGYPLTLATIDEAGATDAFKELVSSGRYVELLEKPAAKMARSAEIHGIEAVLNPKVRIGTCHSAKGQQADHVVCLNRIPYPAKVAMESEAGLQEERRVWYVTASRARRKLTIAEGDGDCFEDL